MSKKKQKQNQAPREKIEVQSVDFSDTKEEPVAESAEQTDHLKDEEQPAETEAVVNEENVDITEIDDCKETTDLLKDGRYPTAILLETKTPRACFVVLKLPNNTNYHLTLETVINHNNYFGRELKEKVCTTKLIPLEFVQVVKTDAKVHLLYSKML